MTAQPSYAPPPPPAPPPSSLPAWVRWVGLGCGAFVLLGVVVGSVIFLVVRKATAGPEATIQAFLAAAGSGDFTAAHGYFAAPLKEVQPLEQFSSVAAANRHLFEVKETTFNNRSVDLNGAELSGTVTLATDTELPATFKLVKEGGEWRLISYQIGSG
jgi:hypothetical protein